MRNRRDGQSSSTANDCTSFSPNYLLFERELVSAVDIALGGPRPPCCSVNDCAYHTRECMAEAYAMVRAHSDRCAEVSKRHYDASVKPLNFRVGDQVWYFCPRARPGTSPKWTRFYSGPYEVVRKINDVNYVIRPSPRGQPKIVHVNKLKPYREFRLV